MFVFWCEQHDERKAIFAANLKRIEQHEKKHGKICDACGEWRKNCREGCTCEKCMKRILRDKKRKKRKKRLKKNFHKMKHPNLNLKEGRKYDCLEGIKKVLDEYDTCIRGMKRHRKGGDESSSEYIIRDSSLDASQTEFVTANLGSLEESQAKPRLMESSLLRQKSLESPEAQEEDGRAVGDRPGRQRQAHVYLKRVPRKENPKYKRRV